MKSLSLLKNITKNNEVYLVGGAIRDFLLNKEIKDIDLLIMSELENVLDKFITKTGHKKIILDKERKIYRVVIEENKFVDFTNPVGQDLLQDLGCRDFTINSMAVRFKDIMVKQDGIELKKEDIIDPYSGLKDLDNKILRMVDKNFIQNDPVRILRSYRFSNNLNFEIEEKTRAKVLEETFLIVNIKEERIKEELYHLFSKPLNPKFFKEFLSSELVYTIFNVKTYQNEKNQKLFVKYLNNLTQKKYLDKIELENHLINLIVFFILPILKDELSIETLKHDLIDYTFNKKKVNIIGDYLFSINNILKDYKSLLNDDILIYEELFFKSTDANILKYFLLNLIKAEVRAAPRREAVIQILNKLEKMRERASFQYINGNEIKEILNLKEGRLIGKILKNIKRKQALGMLNSKEEVITFLKNNY